MEDNIFTEEFKKYDKTQILTSLQNDGVYSFKNALSEVFIHSLLEDIKNHNFIAVEPNNIESLISEISKTNFGIFIDSGPLHIAKCFNKNGIFVETSVSSKVLLSNSTDIKSVKNKYKSNYCNGPCGLVDIFAYDAKIGCYETHKLNFKDIISFKNQKNLQRWNKKENNSHLISNPVGCIKQIDVKNIIELIRYKIKES